MRYILFVAVIGVFGFESPALGQAPTALVEDVSGKSANVEFMDYVVPGRVIKLGAQDTLVLGYMKSCLREVITGGVVIVGTEQSDVALGNVQRTQVACDGGQMQLTFNQAKQSAGIVMRNLAAGARADKPRIMLYGLSPVFEVGKPGTVTISRTDQVGDAMRVDIAGPAQLVRGKFYDTAKTQDLVLTAGATYLATFDTQSVAFSVSPDATTGNTPIIGRLLKLRPDKPIQ
jgi:hypothetical protein